MNRDDLTTLKKEYNIVKYNRQSFHDWWIEKQKFLSIHDFAAILDVGLQRTRAIRRRLGIKSPRKINPPPQNISIKQRKVIPVAPENWRTKEWLHDAIHNKGYSIKYIAKMVRLHRSWLKNIIKRLGVTWTKDASVHIKSKNKCCNHKWCYVNYIILQQSQTVCGQLAGVPRQTFTEWLVNFNIPIRSNVFSNVSKRFVPVWEKKLIYKLLQQNIVKRVKLGPNYIRVLYVCGYSEYYYYELIKKPSKPYKWYEIDKANCRIVRIPQISYEFKNINGTTNFPAHIKMDTSELNSASMIERRLALMNFLVTITKRGWIDSSFPDHIIDADFAMLCEESKNGYKKYINDGYFSKPFTNSLRYPGRRSMLHFFGLASYDTHLKDPHIMARILNKLYKSDKPFNYLNMLGTLSSNELIIRMRKKLLEPIQDPLMYIAIFKSLNISGTILDINIGQGSRAIACATLGLNYTTIDNSISQALSKGIVDKLRLKYSEYVDQNVDVLIYDNGVTNPPDMDLVSPYFKKAKMIMIFAVDEHREFMMQFNPRKSVRFKTKLCHSTPGYLFIW